MAAPESYKFGPSFVDTSIVKLFGEGKTYKDLNDEQRKKLDKYILSDEGKSARTNFNFANNQRYDNWLGAVKNYMSKEANALKSKLKPYIPSSNSSISDDKTEVVLTVSEEDPWLAVAKKYNFNSLDEVKTWLQQNGLAADGKFGKQSLAKWNALKNPTGQKPELVSKTAAQQTVSTTPITRELLLNTNYFRPHHGFQKTVIIDGVRYPVIVTKGLDENNEYGLKNDQSYALDTNTGMIRELNEDGFGALMGGWANKNGNWLTINNTLFEKKSTPKVTAETLTENHIYKLGGSVKLIKKHYGGGSALIGVSIPLSRPKDASVSFNGSANFGKVNQSVSARVQPFNKSRNWNVEGSTGVSSGNSSFSLPFSLGGTKRNITNWRVTPTININKDSTNHNLSLGLGGNNKDVSLMGNYLMTTNQE